MPKFRGEYGASSADNFIVIDAIPTTHPFCVTARHVAYASDHCGGILGDEAIERSGIPCGVKGCSRKLHEHEFALLIECAEEAADKATGKAVPELHEYLLKIKEECEKNGYVGFAFLRKEVTNGADTGSQD
jgi:hypothetical protein